LKSFRLDLDDTVYLFRDEGTRPRHWGANVFARTRQRPGGLAGHDRRPSLNARRPRDASPGAAGTTLPAWSYSPA